MAEKLPPKPQPHSDEPTTVDRPSAKSAQVPRVLRRMEDEGSVTLTAPLGVKRGNKVLPRAAVGVRALPVEATGTNARALEQRDVSRERVQGGKDERRQRVWAKLDDAKSHADTKAERIKKFEPPRS